MAPFPTAVDRRWVAIVAVGCVLTGLIGFALGASRSNVTIRSCPAYVAPTEATATCSDGVAYGIPIDNVEWSDASGADHEGDRPACLPLGPQRVDRVTFASVDAKVNNVGLRPVIWIFC